MRYYPQTLKNSYSLEENIDASSITDPMENYFFIIEPIVTWRVTYTSMNFPQKGEILINILTNELSKPIKELTRPPSFG